MAETYQTTTVLWDTESKDSAVLTKKNGDKLHIKVGDFITYLGRPDGVKVTGFSSKTSEPSGPLGMYYTPWRKDSQTWAEPKWCLKGDLRHIIAFPCGVEHWGEQIDWEAVKFLNNGICPL